MRTVTSGNEAAYDDFVAWIDGYYRHCRSRSPSINLQKLRERAEEILGPTHDTDPETFMRTPNALLSGETPWDVL